MAIPSVLAEAGFATGAGGSGALAVVGCGVSGFLSPHIYVQASSVRYTYKTTVARPGCKSLYLPSQNWDKSITGVAFLKVTRAGEPGWEDKTLQECGLECNGKLLSPNGKKISGGFSSPGVPPDLCKVLKFKTCRQDAGATGIFNTCEARPLHGLESLRPPPEQ
jgi:hypothetical protein